MATHTFMESTIEASDELYDYCCSLCAENNKTSEALKYCNTCAVYLCNDCLQYHNRFPLMRAHVIVDTSGQADESRWQDKTLEEGDVRCAVHHANNVITFCKEHDELCCQTCIALKHRSCNIKISIIEAAEGIKSSHDYQTNLSSLTDVLTEMNEEKNKRLGKLTNLELKKQSFLKQVDKYREDLHAKINDLADESTRQIMLKYNKADAKGRSNITTLDTVIVSASHMLQNFSAKNNVVAFYHMKPCKSVITECRALLQEMTQMEDENLEFTLNTSILTDLTQNTTLMLEECRTRKYIEESTDQANMSNKHRGSIIKRPRLVIALDVGSTYSGYAWQERSEFETNRSIVHFNTHWGAGALQLHKTTTCILLECPRNDEGAVDHGASQRKHVTAGSDVKVWIGHEAERKYSGLARQKQEPRELVGQYYFFKRFKQLLYNKDFRREQLAEDQILQQLPLFDVTTLFIKALKDHCLKTLDKLNVQYDLAKTLFVVTVPAIWSNEAKKFMRDAAVEAGIGKRNILLGLEPVAAAIHCINLPEDHSRNMNDLGLKGQKFLIVDLGGETTDLSAVKVEECGLLSEILPLLSDPVGGQKINEAFLKTCHDSFEGPGWKEIFSKATPVEMQKMEQDFEELKFTVGADDPDEEFMALEVPRPVKETLDDKTIRLKAKESVKFEGHEFMFNSGYVRGHLFPETCVLYNTLCTVLKKKEAKDINTAMLVGGFVESQILVTTLQRMITKDFPHIKVVVPSSPFEAVLKGAVLFGHDPRIFHSRISRETFGIETHS